jgi:2-dehydro-3-deoxyphosphooctonate aldolase (KDO 8-P synthase)
MRLADFDVGNDQRLFLIAGPCVIESEALALDTAGYLRELSDKLGIRLVYKSSFDKANRTSHQSFRGPGMEQGLAILEKVKAQIGVPVLTDVHEDTPKLPRWSTCCKPPHFCAGRPTSSKRWPARASP